jgi:hypothetical protein
MYTNFGIQRGDTLYCRQDNNHCPSDEPRTTRRTHFQRFTKKAIGFKKKLNVEMVAEHENEMNRSNASRTTIGEQMNQREQATFCLSTLTLMLLGCGATSNSVNERQVTCSGIGCPDEWQKLVLSDLRPPLPLRLPSLPLALVRLRLESLASVSQTLLIKSATTASLFRTIVCLPFGISSFTIFKGIRNGSQVLLMDSDQESHLDRLTHFLLSND